MTSGGPPDTLPRHAIRLAQTRVTMTASALLEAALVHHRAGRLADAAALYGQVLRDDPEQPDALHLLGVTCQQTGKLEQAEKLIMAAVGLRPDNATFHNNLGVTHQARRKWTEAAEAFAAATRLNPASADAVLNLAALAIRLGPPHFLPTWRALTALLVITPDLVAAMRSLATITQRLGDMEASLRRFRRASTADPLAAETWAEWGKVLLTDNRWVLGQTVLQRALCLDPANAEAAQLLGYVATARLALAEAERWLTWSIHIHPGFATPYSTLSELWAVRGNRGQSIACARAAVERDSINPDLHFRLGAHLLEAGVVDEGWREYDWLYRKHDAVQRIGVPARWQGEPLTGKTLLICADQGVGDEILGASCVRDVIDMGARVIMECDPRLLPVARRSFPDALVEPYERDRRHGRPVQSYEWIPDGFRPDFYIEGFAMPRFLRSSVAMADGAGKPWFRADPVRVEAMRDALAPLPPGQRIGVSWRSMKLTEEREPHYPGLAAMAPVLSIQGTCFVALQYGAGWREEITASDHTIHLIDGLDTTRDLDGVLALISALDLVICPSSTVAWLGASLGKPVWLAGNDPSFLSYGTNRFPGFPTIRRFTKPLAEPWDDVMRDMAAMLRDRSGEHSV